MSTSVTPDEWGSLTPVPRESYKSFPQTDSSGPGIRCDVEPSHGMGIAYMQTPDHRGIILCGGCMEQVLRLQQED